VEYVKVCEEEMKKKRNMVGTRYKALANGWREDGMQLV
jgi:hypothetical protein